MSSWKLAGRSVLAVVVGYAVMFGLITLVQEGMFGGVAFGSSSTPVLAASGILSCAAAFVGGFVAAWVAGRAYRTHALVISGLILIETTALLATGQFEGPVWYHVSAEASLIAGIVAGAEVFARRGIGRLAISQ